ncbi:protein-disulfide reductase DsbD family protein [Dyadobacter fermentans]|uniref:Cytochrome c biogenesis protein transmembrane region n=1 Tax=Dyadobacter fermentans (strain ATCC 700827 / DSM 18053 / CIP 107007 / KCTC 52180 / NS114) TaxID=471854 RepID=C6W049_DYAFD|nr:cytochrome c biogenesis protein CcdA [Dyadobacter fermentans]ACT95376.1 cytochrome c biogenesis protein transmembrane region [Dyadobacter fermentans DSM 18053]
MKRGILFILSIVLFVAGVVQAQIQKPKARWTYSFSKPEVKKGETVDLVFTATIDKDWYMYSSDFDPDLGPVLTTFTFEKNNTFEVVGKLKPQSPKTKFEEVWGGNVRYFEGKGVFKQTVKILADNPVIKGASEFQTCSHVTGLCIAGGEDFEFKGLKVAAAGGSQPHVGAATPANTQSGAASATETAKSAATTSSGVATPASASAATNDTAISISASDNPAAADSASAATTAPTASTEVTAATDTPADGSLLGFALAAFLSGLVALLTPCVFPIIPMTVSFFTNQEKGKFKALLYGISIILIYTLIGTVVSRLNGPAFANFLSTHWLPNLLFFAIFITFGLSFLGLFEIVLPSGFVNKMDQKADQGGYAGVFFMAFTLVLVSFSCTGPIVGSLLVASAGGEVVKPIVGMAAFSAAFAIPFTSFALFPQWLKSLPKSGGWLNAVKVVLGFLELALALKFFSIADQVYHWNLLDREIYLAFWIVIFALLGFYLLGKIRTPHDSPIEKVSVPRLLLAIVTFTFVVYMIPGMFGAPLKALAGYLPPQSTLDFDLSKRSAAATTPSALAGESRKYADLFHLPHELEGFYDYQEALAYAKKVNKPVFIDFTGHGCVNCREMEARVWVDPAVLQRLNNDYVIVALYVDDKTELPESQWYTSKYDNKVKKTIGAQNADLQIVKYNNNAQPHYCLVDHEGNLLVSPKNYDLDPAKFAAFLDSGKAAFGKK